jgi:RNA ligase
VWEALATDTFGQLLEVVPDEFHPWVRGVESDLRGKYARIDEVARRDLADILRVDPDAERRVLADQIKNTDHPGLCFAVLDGKDIAPRIWQMIKPERSMAMIVEEV